MILGSHSAETIERALLRFHESWFYEAFMALLSGAVAVLLDSGAAASGERNLAPQSHREAPGETRRGVEGQRLTPLSP